MHRDHVHAWSAGTTELKVGQLQQYLYRPGRIPTAVHPLIKHEIRKAKAKRKALLDSQGCRSTVAND